MRNNSKLCSLRCNLHEEEFSAKEISIQVEISPVLVCDGLLLCATVTGEENNIQQRLMVWNPYLGQTRWIQPAKTPYNVLDTYYFGYDNNRCNHKILRCSMGECEIYDFKSGSWRILDLDDVTLTWGSVWDYGWRGDSSVSLKGNTYFLDYDTLSEGYTDTFICFDFTRETFGEYLDLPNCSHHDNNYYHDFTPISSFGEEKLAALCTNGPIFGMEIWVTTKIEPIEVLWTNFLKIDLESIPRFTPRSFFINEETKRAVLFSDDDWRQDSLQAYIIGENDFFKAVVLGEINLPRGDLYSFQVVCSNSYVPSLVQIKQN